MGKVTVDLPSFAPVVGFLNVHGGGSEGFEGDDDVSHVELGLQVQLDGDVLFPIASLSGELGLKFQDLKKFQPATRSSSAVSWKPPGSENICG